MGEIQPSCGRTNGETQQESFLAGPIALREQTVRTMDRPRAERPCVDRQTDIIKE